MWKFSGKAQFPHSFGQIARNYAETVPLKKKSHTMELGEITAFYTVVTAISKNLKMKPLKYYFPELFKQICGALRDFVPFVQFKKREKHP